MEKGEVQGSSSTQVIISALNKEKEIGFTKIKGTSYIENLFAIIQTNSNNQIAMCWNYKVAQRVFWGNAKW